MNDINFQIILECFCSVSLPAWLLITNKVCWTCLYIVIQMLWGTNDKLIYHSSSTLGSHAAFPGAVGCITTVKNPIRVARAVMEKSDHVLLVGPGAEKFAHVKMGIPRIDNSKLVTRDTIKTFKKHQVFNKAIRNMYSAWWADNSLEISEHLPLELVLHTDEGWSDEFASEIPVPAFSLKFSIDCYRTCGSKINFSEMNMFQIDRWTFLQTHNHELGLSSPSVNWGV